MTASGVPAHRGPLLYSPQRVLETVQMISGLTPVRLFSVLFPLWEVEIKGEMGTKDAFTFINNHLKGKKAVIGLTQDYKDPATAQLAVKAFKETLGGTYMMDIVDIIHVTDVRDVGDMPTKTDVLKKIFTTGEDCARGK